MLRLPPLLWVGDPSDRANCLHSWLQEYICNLGKFDRIESIDVGRLNRVERTAVRR